MVSVSVSVYFENGKCIRFGSNKIQATPKAVGRHHIHHIPTEILHKCSPLIFRFEYIYLKYNICVKKS